MNFLTMVQRVRELSGMQGTGPTSVSNTVGVDSVIVRFVQHAYRDIQNKREEWTWLRKDVSFSTTIGKHIYTTTDILGALHDDLKDYKTDTIRILSNGSTSYMRELDEYAMERKYLDDTTQGVPSEFSIDTSDNSLVLRVIPDGPYTVSFSYFQIPQELTLDADIPRMPVAYHDAIIYEALRKLSVYLKTPEIYSEYAAQAQILLGQLMRGTLKSKRIMTRPMA